MQNKKKALAQKCNNSLLIVMVKTQKMIFSSLLNYLSVHNKGFYRIYISTKLYIINKKLIV